MTKCLAVKLGDATRVAMMAEKAGTMARAAPWLIATGLILLLATLLLLSFHRRIESDVDRNKAALPFDDLLIARDVAYTEGDRHTLDVYTPRGSGVAKAAVVIFFYGGGWDSGAKADFAWVGAALARRGYVAVVPDYRVYPQVVWPKFLEDCAAALKWTRDHISEYSGDPSALILMGHSAGAYNAVDLAVDRRWLAGVGMDPRNDLRAAIGLSGPYDFLPLDRNRLKIIFGPESQRPDTQPINHVDGRSPPLLLIIGDRDEFVDPPESDRLGAKVREKGGEATVIHYGSLDHGGTINALAEPQGELSQVMEDITAFIGAQLRRP